MGRNYLNILCCVAAPLAILCAAPAGAIAPLISFSQVDFTSLGMGGSVEWSQAASDWGSIDLLADPGMTSGYVNLMVEGEWRIRNMPLFDYGAPGTPAEVTFNFSLGNMPGQRVETLGYGFSLTAAPVTAAPVMAGVANVGVRDVVMGGNFGTEAWAYVLADPVLEGDIHTKNGLLKDFPNQTCGPMLCGPAAVSNGFQWLNSKYGLGMAAGDINIGSVQKGLKVVPPNGAFKTWMEDKKKYVADKKLPIKTRSTRDIEKAMAALAKGQAVEMGFILGKAGHIASVVGISELKNGTFQISVAHDTNQFNNAAGKKIETGTYDPKTKLIKGIMGMTSVKPGQIGFTMQQAILPKVAAVPEPASWAMLITGFGLTGMAMRRRRFPQPA